MADEIDTQGAGTATAEAGAEAGIDQAGYFDDVQFSDPAAGGQSAGETTVKPETKAGEEVADPAAQAAATAQDPNAGKKPDQKQAENDFVKSYLNEDGTLNLDKYIQDFPAGGASDGKPADAGLKVAPRITETAKPAEGGAPAKTQAQQYLEERTAYKTNILQNLDRPIQYFQQAVKSGYTPEQALAYAQQKAREDVAEHMDAWEAERRAKADEERIRAHEERIAEANLVPRSNTNHLHVAAKMKMPVERLQAMLFDPKLGGVHIEKFFRLSHPEYFKPGAYTAPQVSEAYQKWYLNAAQDPGNIEYFAELARMTIDKQVRPHLISRIRGAAETAAKDQRMAGVAPGQKTSKTTNAPKRNELENYMFGEDKRFKADEV